MEFFPEFQCLTRRVSRNTIKVRYKSQSLPACRFLPRIS